METLQYFTIIAILIELSLVVYLAKNKKITKKFYKALYEVGNQSLLRKKLTKSWDEYIILNREYNKLLKEHNELLKKL